MPTDHDDTPLDLTDSTWSPMLKGDGAAAVPLRPCVVLAGLDTPIPEPLHQALHEAGLTPRIEHDPRLAMAEVCLLRRDARHRMASGQPHSDLAPLVFLRQPTGGTQDMVDTLQRSIPDVPLLLLAGDTLQLLHAVEPQSADIDPDEILSLLGPPEQDPA